MRAHECDGGCGRRWATLTLLVKDDTDGCNGDAHVTYEDDEGDAIDAGDDDVHDGKCCICGCGG